MKEGANTVKVTATAADGTTTKAYTVTVTKSRCSGRVFSAELLADVENYLNITWDDETTDNKIRGFIAAAMAYLNEKGGSVLDYDADGLPRTLMMEYVRYARDEALDVFENNYMALILNMQNGRMVREYVESTKQTEA